MLSACSVWECSEGGAYIYNLMNGYLITGSQSRYTPYHLNHSTQVKGLCTISCGDNRFYNNILSSYKNEHTYGLGIYDSQPWPCFAADNLVCDNPHVNIEEIEGKVYLSFVPEEQIYEGKIVDSKRLGITHLSNYAYEASDGSPLHFDKDYLGKNRSASSPHIGPFENQKIERLLVWE